MKKRNTVKITIKSALAAMLAVMLLTVQVVLVSAAAKPKLNVTAYTLVKGQSFTLSIANASGTVKWKNSNSSAVSLSKKKSTSYTVKGKKAGKATITVTNKSKNYSCKVTVVNSLSKPVFSASNASGGVSLTWKKISGATGYKIYRKTGSGSYSLLKTLKSGSDVKYTDTKVKSGTAYTYAVKSVQGSYASAFNEKKITFLSQPILKASVSSSGVKLSWGKITGASSYKIYRKASGSSYSAIKTVSSGSTVSFTDSSATDGRTYYYYITALKDTFKSASSKAVKATSKKEKGLVACFKVENGKAINTLNGKAVSGAKVDGSYFKGGTLTLPNSYTTWTIQIIVDYNESSKKGIINYVNWMDDILRLEETVDSASRGAIRHIWVPNSYASVRTSVPVQLYAHASCNYEFLPTGDTFWSFSYNRSNGTLNTRIDGGTNAVVMPSSKDEKGNITYPTKTLWQSFNLNSDHKIKEFRVYSKAKTAAEQKSAYEKTGIKAPTYAICKPLNGLSGFGSPYLFSKTSAGVVTMLNSQTKKGTYTVKKNGLSATYSLVNYVQPNNGIDNSKYTSVHITNAPKTLEKGKQYPLSAYPYPFNINGKDGKSDEYDISWSSSDTSVLTVTDGLLIAKKAGTAKITATLIGTSTKTTVTVKVVDKPAVKEKIYNVPSNYKTKNGDTFSKTNYQSTTRAIYAAIDYAAANGYTRVVFPKQNYYAAPLWATNDIGGYTYYVPSGITIEFAKGSVFYMKDNEVIRSKTWYNFFYFGVGANDYNGKCENSHLIMDKYYGERYKTTYKESEFSDESRFVCFGRKSINCSVQINEANYSAGYFILIEGRSADSSTEGKIKAGDFINGRLSGNGSIAENTNWISTKTYISVPDYGKDGYFLSSSNKYWQGTGARLYDIYWFDSSKNFISSDLWQGTGEYYPIPENAAFCKISLHQSSLPTGNADSTILALHDDGASKMCEVKNITCYYSGAGISTIIGETDGLWIHNCIKDIHSPSAHKCSVDFENGWCAMRHSVVSNCYLPGYFGSNGGYNTFLHTNYLGEQLSAFSGETEMLRVLNNAVFNIEISEKNQAHIYYNTMYSAPVDRQHKSIGHIYAANNTSRVFVNAY